MNRPPMILEHPPELSDQAARQILDPSTTSSRPSKITTSPNFASSLDQTSLCSSRISSRIFNTTTKPFADESLASSASLTGKDIVQRSQAPIRRSFAIK